MFWAGIFPMEENVGENMQHTLPDGKVKLLLTRARHLRLLPRHAQIPPRGRWGGPLTSLIQSSIPPQVAKCKICGPLSHPLHT